MYFVIVIHNVQGLDSFMEEKLWILTSSYHAQLQTCQH